MSQLVHINRCHNYIGTVHPVHDMHFRFPIPYKSKQLTNTFSIDYILHVQTQSIEWSIPHLYLHQHYFTKEERRLVDSEYYVSLLTFLLEVRDEFTSDLVSLLQSSFELPETLYWTLFSQILTHQEEERHTGWRNRGWGEGEKRWEDGGREVSTETEQQYGQGHRWMWTKNITYICGVYILIGMRLFIHLFSFWNGTK